MIGMLNVTQYQVSTTRSRTNPDGPRFSLSLSGNSMGGVVTRAIIDFLPTPPVNNVGYINDDLLFGLLPAVDFGWWYDILRHEKPVRIYYAYDPSQPKISAISLGTTDEGVGEGPRDFNA